MATEHQEVINHGIDVINSEFKKLMIKNKELQKENDKLKEENHKATILLLKQDEVQDKLYDDKEKLKKDNEKLNEMKKYDKFKCNECKAHHTGCSNPTCDTCVEQMIKKLKEENEKLEQTNRLFLFAEVGYDDKVKELEKEIEKLKEEYEDLENNFEQLEHEKDDLELQSERDDERIEELEKEIVQLKKPLTNKDMRCSPFDVKVNVNYILELMEIKREEIDFDEYELWKDFDEQVKDNLMIELAQCIEGYINRYCTNPSHQTWSEYICEEFCNDLDELLQNDYYSEHIKYEEDEKGDWKYTPIKNEE